MTTQVWAHRGASAYAPENTIPAFETALEMNCDGIEFDVQRSSDGHLVVIHDDTVNRTSNGIGRVVDHTLEELRRLDFVNGFVGYRRLQIPTLREVLELLAPSQVQINIELKNNVELYPGLEEDALLAAREAGVLDRVIFSSFNHFSLANLRGLVSPEQLALLYAEGLYDPWHYAQSFGAGALHPTHFALQQPNYLWLAHEAGIAVRTWTVDDESEIKHLAGLGVDGVFTNFPDRALKVLGHNQLGW